MQAGHTIICLGDVLHEDVWRNESLMNEIRSCPGDRVLVLGNHDGNARGLRLLGFTVQHTLALCATDPPLALSHEPLRQIPPGAICVHGHLHEGTEPTVRHISVAVVAIPRLLVADPQPAPTFGVRRAALRAEAGLGCKPRGRHAQLAG